MKNYECVETDQKRFTIMLHYDAGGTPGVGLDFLIFWRFPSTVSSHSLTIAESANVYVPFPENDGYKGNSFGVISEFSNM